MTAPFPHPLIDDIRAASRRLVRQLGFMGGDFAGADLSPSAVHALIEIESENITARDLAQRLRLEKSSVSRMLRKLIDTGEVTEEPADDGRAKLLSLTDRGRQRVQAIHTFARAQVADALQKLDPASAQTVLDGLTHYATALAAPDNQGPLVEIVEGYRTGLIARVTQMHADYYAQASGFGQRFESVVAGGLAEFCDRLHHPQNAVWTATRAGEIIGSVAIDGQDLSEGIGHLRWFIADDRIRGTGAGRKLLSAALNFVDGQGFKETHLWTFSGLNAARHLYEANGFVLAEEQSGSQWGKEVLEQRFVRPQPDGMAR